MKKRYIVFPVTTAVLLVSAVISGIIISFDNAVLAMIIAASIGFCSTVFAVLCAVLWRRDARELDRRAAELVRQSEEYELLLQAQKAELQKQFSEDVLRFYSRVAHGMRIPISIVMGYADLLRGGLITDEEAKTQYLGKICDRVSYMNDLLGQMLLEARTTAGVPAIMMQPLDVLELIRSVADELGSVALKKGVILRVNSVDDKAMIMGDVMHLTKIFYNIIENSLKYMGCEGTVNITVSCADGVALIVFKDDGKGISPQETARIFDQNFQGSNKLSGHGLGLYLVKEVVAAHGGTVSAKSDIGRGMGIYINLPLAQPQTGQGESVAAHKAM